MKNVLIKCELEADRFAAQEIIKWKKIIDTIDMII